MGQFKKGKQDTIVIGEGHSLMLGHMPNSIPSDAYSELNFGLISNHLLSCLTLPVEPKSHAYALNALHSHVDKHDTNNLQ